MIEGNTILARDTSDIFIANLYGAVNNVTVNHNYLAGADVGIRVEGTKSSSPITNVALTNNYVEKGHWGYYNIEKASPTMLGNILFEPGHLPTLPVPSPDPTPDPIPHRIHLPTPRRHPTPTPDPATQTFWGTRGDDVLTGSGKRRNRGVPCT